MTKQGPTGKYAEAVIKEFPEASSLGLARILLKKHPLVYKDLDDARQAVRYLRGARGNQVRHRAKYEPSPLSVLLGRIPKSYSLRDTSPYPIVDCDKLAVIGDLHIPYHSTPAIHAMLEHLSKTSPRGILINGDLIDCHRQSHFQTDPNSRDFVGESSATITFLELLRDMFPKIAIWYKFGNHEERHEKYLWEKCPEIYGHPNFQLENILELDRLKIKSIRDKRRVLFGKLNILHGHEYRCAIGRPVNPARWLLLKAKCNVLANHFHSQSVDSQCTIAADELQAWTNGCLCDRNPLYAPYNEWSWGFSITEKTSDDGDFHLDQKRISQTGKIY